MSNKLAAIKQFGQKIWVDNISRELLDSGALAKMIKEDGIAGVTSNPAIFFNAIANDPRYQHQLHQLKATKLTPVERYEQIALSDIKQACKIMQPLYNETLGTDGYVSLEVAPDLCHDTQATIKSAEALWFQANQPNLMIKVPATPAGILAFHELIKRGINVNITLLFTLSQVHQVWDAYIKALEYRVAHNLEVTTIKAVASFFLSRIDSAIDEKLPPSLQGKTAISLARVAYSKYQEIFHGPRFQKLSSHGCKPQYLLWASTGTKNKNYSNVLYVEELIGPETINTVPDATLAAYREHGNAAPRLTQNPAAATLTLQQVAHAGIDLEQLGEKLQQDGLALFSAAFTKLIALVA
jgi:transaldolase